MQVHDSVPNTNGKGADTGLTQALARLPLELVIRILETSASSPGPTWYARNVCLVCREAYRACWPYLYRIVAIRDARQLKAFSECIYPPQHRPCRAGLAMKQRSQEQDGDVCSSNGPQPNGAATTAHLRLRRMQDALTFLYINNNKDGTGLRELATDEKPEMWMISILLAASNLRVIHFEEYWSLTYPWEAQEEKPLIAYPLMLLSRFTAAVHAAFLASPNAAWVKRILKIDAQEQGDGTATGPAASLENAPTTDIYDAIMALERAESLRQCPPRLLAQPSEVTLSALAVTRSHIVLSGANDLSSKTRELPANETAFVNLQRMHLYFAKLSVYFCDALMSLPALTHLRLTRPFAENIIESVVTILERGYTSTNPYELLSRQPSSATSRLPALQSLIIETGIYMDASTIRALRDLETSEIGRGRLHVKTAEWAASRGRLTMQQPNLTGSHFAEALQRAVPASLRSERTPVVQPHDVTDEAEEPTAEPAANSTSDIVNYVTSSEQRGFEDFVARAHGLDGVWAVNDTGSS